MKTICKILIGACLALGVWHADAQRVINTRDWSREFLNKATAADGAAQLGYLALDSVTNDIKVQVSAASNSLSGVITTSSNSLASSSRQYSKEAIFDVENYGATPCRQFDSVSSTTGSATISISGGDLTAADVGAVIVLWQDSTNNMMIESKIVSVASATSATLADNALRTGTFNAVIGQDCTTNIQAAINDAWKNKGGGTVLLPWTYLLDGKLTNALSGANSVLYVPTDGGVGMKTLRLLGTKLPVQSARGSIAYQPSLECSGLFCATTNFNFNASNSIISFGVNLPMETLKLDGLQIASPKFAPLTGIWAYWGGNLTLDDVVFTAAYEVGFTGYGNTNGWGFDPNPLGTNSPAAVVWPTQNNPANSIAHQVTVQGFPVGMYYSEHTELKSCTLFYNGVGLKPVSSLSSGNFGDVRFDKVNMVNRIELAFPTNYHSGTSYTITANITSLQIDGTSPNVWDDPNHCLHGFVSYLGNPIPAPINQNTGLALYRMDDANGPSFPSLQSVSGSMNLVPANGNVQINAVNGKPTIAGWGRADGYLGLEDGYIQFDNVSQTTVFRSYVTNGWLFLNNVGQEKAGIDYSGNLTLMGTNVASVVNAQTNVIGSTKVGQVPIMINYKTYYIDLYK